MNHKCKVFDCKKMIDVTEESRGGVDMNMTEEYFKYQINGLILILKQTDSNPTKDFMISKNYVIEKLNMILSDGIGFHPSILEKLK